MSSNNRSEITRITLSFLKDPENMPKDNTMQAELEDDELELPEFLEEENNKKIPVKKKKKPKEEDKEEESDEFVTGQQPTIVTGHSKNELFKKKTGVY